MNQVYQDKRYYQVAEGILRNKEFQRRRTFLHHQDSVYAHSLRVSYVAYRMATFLEKYISISVDDVIISGLLHDFYLHPWREQKHKTLEALRHCIHEKAEESYEKTFHENTNKHIPSHQKMDTQEMYGQLQSEKEHLTKMVKEMKDKELSKHK